MSVVVPGGFDELSGKGKGKRLKKQIL
jgi:hypothetical protein